MAALIFGLSSIPGDRLTLHVFDRQDLVAHALVFGILAYLICRALTREVPWSPAARAGVALLAAGLYGISDELHQALVPFRHPDWRDALADLAGAALGAGAWRIQHARSQGRTSKARER